MTNDAHDTATRVRMRGVPVHRWAPSDSWLTEADRRLGELDASLWSTASQAELDQRFLSAAVTALAAVGGAIWIRNGDSWQQRCVVDWPEGQTADFSPGSPHERLLTSAGNGGHPCLVPPHAASEEGPAAGNETEFTVILVPFGEAASSECILEILRPPNAGPTLQRGFLRLAAELGKLIQEHELYVRFRELPDRLQWWQELEPFVRNVFASMDPRCTAKVLAEQGRRILRCDRLTVLRFERRGRLRLISRSESTRDGLPFDSETFEPLVQRACLAGRSLWYHGRTHHWPPSMVRLLDAYLDRVPLGVLGLVPLIIDTHPIPAGGSNIDTHPIRAGKDGGPLSGGVRIAHGSHAASNHLCDRPESSFAQAFHQSSALPNPHSPGVGNAVSGRLENREAGEPTGSPDGDVPSPHFGRSIRSRQRAASGSGQPALAATIFGVLVVEKATLDRDVDGIMARAASVAEHGGRALWHAVEHERALQAFSKPFWRRWGGTVQRIFRS